jgi:hypothetical protein
MSAVSGKIGPNLNRAKPSRLTRRRLPAQVDPHRDKAINFATSKCHLETHPAPPVIEYGAPLFLIEPGFGEAHGSFRPCDSTDNEAGQRSEQYEGGPITMNASRCVSEKRHPDQQRRKRSYSSSKGETYQPE